MNRVEFVTGWKKQLDQEIEKFLDNLAGDVLTDMRQHCPVRTGALLADLGKEVNGNTARIGAATVPYAAVVEEGAGPHLIFPNSAGALAWPGMHSPHPVNMVRHPGSPATHFMRNALYKERA